MGPKIGFDASTTTAFCTVDRTTSGILTRRAEAAICWLHLDRKYEPQWASARRGDARYTKNGGGFGAGGYKVEVGIVLGTL